MLTSQPSCDWSSLKRQGSWTETMYRELAPICQPTELKCHYALRSFLFCANLTETHGAQTFGEMFFWMCLCEVLDFKEEL